MVRPKLDILRLFNPATDFLALFAVLLGLGIAVFLDATALKLIGVCISILGGVGLFMLFSQRLKDTSFLNTPKPVSETTSFKTTVRQDTATKRLIFDDYAESFGRDEFSGKEKEDTDDDDTAPEQAAEPARRPAQRPVATAPPAASFDSIDEGFTILPKGSSSRTEAPVEQRPEPRPAAAHNSADDFSDGSSSMRILGSVKKSTTVPTPTAPAAKPAPAKEKEQSSKTTKHDTSTAKTNTAKQSVQPTAQTQASKTAQTQPVPQAKPVDTGTAVAKTVAAKTADTKTAEVKPVESKQTESKQQQPTAPVSQLAAERVPDTKPTAQEKPATPQPSTANTEQSVDHGGHKRKTLNIQLADIIEETPNTIKNEPRKEFDFLISRVLMVIRSVISARTTLFFWVNFDKQELVLESKICDKPESLRAQRKFALANDVISQIALSGTPEILTEINPSAELDLLPYYQTSAATRSFVGVPVYFNNNVVGILTADTTEEDAYDSITVSFLGHFTKLISGLIQGYTEKYDLLQSARTLEVVDTFRRLVNSRNVSREDVCTALMESVDSLISYVSIGICIYNEETDRWYIAQMRSKSGEDYTGREVHLESTLIGRTIIQGKTAQYDASSTTKSTARIAQGEQPLGSNIAAFIPLKSPSRCYGAIFAETPSSAPLTQQDLEILEVLSEYAGATLEHKHLDSIIHSNALTDETTGVLNSVAFLNRIQEEYYRTTDLRTPFSLCLINVDRYAALSSGNEADFGEPVAQHVVHHIEQHLRAYDVLGRVDATIFGIGLIQKNAREAQLWAERLRGEIASALLQYGGRQFSVTVSIGVVECTVQKTFDEFLANGEQALQIASRKTNAVSLFA